MRSDAPGQLLGAQPVHEERQVRSVLFHGAERKQDDRAGIAREPRRIQVGTLAQLDHVAPVRSPVERGRPGIIMPPCRAGSPADSGNEAIMPRCSCRSVGHTPWSSGPSWCWGRSCGIGDLLRSHLTPRDTSGEPNGPVLAWQLRSISFTVVPLPATLLLIVAGLGGIALLRYHPSEEEAP